MRLCDILHLLLPSQELTIEIDHSIVYEGQMKGFAFPQKDIVVYAMYPASERVDSELIIRCYRR